MQNVAKGRNGEGVRREIGEIKERIPPLSEEIQLSFPFLSTRPNFSKIVKYETTTRIHTGINNDIQFITFRSISRASLTVQYTDTFVWRFVFNYIANL